MIMPALSVKVEYLHYDLGTDKVGGAIGGGVTQFFDVQNTGDLVRVGLNYRFGDRSAPCCGPLK
jgi:opacity protein-like surface antigen